MTNQMHSIMTLCRPIWSRQSRPEQIANINMEETSSNSPIMIEEYYNTIPTRSQTTQDKLLPVTLNDESTIMPRRRILTPKLCKSNK